MNTGVAFAFLIDVLISLYSTAVLLRLLLQWVRADFYNPVVQFLVTITNPPLVRLRRVIPSIGRLDTASVVLIIALEILGVWVVSLIKTGGMSATVILLFAARKLAIKLLLTYFFLIIIAVILSWVGARARHPAVPLVYQLTEPVLRPIRRVIPPIAGFDLAPLFAIIGLQFLLILLGW